MPEHSAEQILAGETAGPDELARFKASPFYASLALALARRGLSPEGVCDLADPGARRLMAEYGAMYVAAETVRVPPACAFRAEPEVEAFQRAVEPAAADFGGTAVELQRAALAALVAAREEARREGLDISPRGGREAARRSFGDTVRLWDSRLGPALTHWVECGCLDGAEAASLRSLKREAQLARVLEFEARGVYFSKCLTKSILYSVAAPGASQHLALLAFDAQEFTDARVREILARRGWFQTVRSDLPHFTYLGVREEELPRLGLKRIDEEGQTFWVPDLG